MIVRLCKVSSWTKHHVEGKDGTAMLRCLEIHLARVPAPDLEVVLKHSDGAHLRIVLTQIMWLPWCSVSLFWSCKVVCIMYLYIYLYISIYLYIYTYIYIYTHDAHIMFIQQFWLQKNGSQFHPPRRKTPTVVPWVFGLRGSPLS